MVSDGDRPEISAPSDALVRGIGWRWLIVIAIAIAGATGSRTMSEWFRADAREAWEDEAVQSQQWLSGTVLAWLEGSVVSRAFGPPDGSRGLCAGMLI